MAQDSQRVRNKGSIANSLMHYSVGDSWKAIRYSGRNNNTKNVEFLRTVTDSFYQYGKKKLIADITNEEKCAFLGYGAVWKLRYFA